MGNCLPTDALTAAQRECEQALMEFLGTEVSFPLLSCARYQADELLAIVAQFTQMEEVNRAIVVGVYGDLQGYLVMILPPSEADRLAGFVLDGDNDPEIQLSVLAEIGNLTTARLLMGIGKAMRDFGQALITPPVTQADFSGALLQSLVALLLSQGQNDVLYTTWQLQVSLPDDVVKGTAHFFLPLQGE